MTPMPLLVVVLGWLCLGLETGLRSTLAFPVGTLYASPSFVIPLAVYIAVCAAPRHAMWSCLGLGVMLDLLSAHATKGEPMTIIGPYALGLMLAGQFVLAVRGLVIRRNPLTVLALSIPAAAIVQIVVVAIVTARHVAGDPTVWNATAELGARLLSALMTGVSGLVMVLMWRSPGMSNSCRASSSPSS